MACSFFTAPAAYSTVPALDALTLSWVPSCLPLVTPSKVDLFLSVEGPDGYTQCHRWPDVSYALGGIEAALDPAWWGAAGATGSVQAQFTLVEANSDVWDSPFPAGPPFSVTFNGTYAPLPADDGSANTVVLDATVPYRIAAGVVIPVLVIALSIFGYKYWATLQRRTKTKRFSQVLEARMSVYSGRPQSMALEFHQADMANAEMDAPRPSFAAANRQSVAGAGPRVSFMESQPRPSFQSSYGYLRDSDMLSSDPSVAGPMRNSEYALDASSRSSGHFYGGDSAGRPSSHFSTFGPGRFLGSELGESGVHKRQSRISFALEGARHSLGLDLLSPHSRPSFDRQGRPSSTWSRRSHYGHGQQGSVSSMSAYGGSNRMSTMSRGSPLSPSFPPGVQQQGKAHRPSPLAARNSMAADQALQSELGAFPALKIVRDGSLAYDLNDAGKEEKLANYAHEDAYEDQQHYEYEKPNPAYLSPEKAKRNQAARNSAQHGGMPFVGAGGGGLFGGGRAGAAQRGSVMSPDQALRSYAAARAAADGGDLSSPQTDEHDYGQDQEEEYERHPQEMEHHPQPAGARASVWRRMFGASSSHAAKPATPPMSYDSAFPSPAGSGSPEFASFPPPPTPLLEQKRRSTAAAGGGAGMRARHSVHLSTGAAATGGGGEKRSGEKEEDDEQWGMAM